MPIKLMNLSIISNFESKTSGQAVTDYRFVSPYIDKIRVYVIQIEGGYGNLNVQTQIEGNPTISD